MARRVALYTRCRLAAYHPDDHREYSTVLAQARDEVGDGPIASAMLFTGGWPVWLGMHAGCGASRGLSAASASFSPESLQEQSQYSAELRCHTLLFCTPRLLPPPTWTAP